ncbi:MAG: DNA cytosine methyltransferase [Erysipelotrichaceae bacterium]
MNNKYKVLSLFAGAGIADFGFDDRFDIVLANELLDIRMKTYKFWHPNTKTICGDITNKEIKRKIIYESKSKKVNFIFATPPCQGVSLIGKNKTNSQMIQDKRNYLIFDIFDIIDEIKPKIIMIENVARFLKIKYPINGKLKDIESIIREKYSNLYTIKCDIFDAQHYGVPQHRKRAIIRMYNNSFNWNDPEKQKTITVREAIGDLPSLESGEISMLKNHNARKHTLSNILCMKYTPTGKSAFENEVHYPKNEVTGNRIKGYIASYKRMDWDKPAPTITMRNDAISSQCNVHPGRKLEDGTYSDARVLTLRELFILSSLNPDLDIPSFASDIQIRHMVGEAVPPKLISAILSGLEKIND